jgi:hypothetical protein
VFALPGNSLCSGFCTTGTVNTQKQQLSKRYMTAWFNYYLLYKTKDYTYLYGAQSAADVSAGLIVKQESTAPRNFSAQALLNAIKLDWTRYDHPIVGGYNVYRRQTGQTYSATPYAQVALGASYVDTQVTAGQVYSYTLRSFDGAVQVHQASLEVSAVPSAVIFTDFIFLPVIWKQ